MRSVAPADEGQVGKVRVAVVNSHFKLTMKLLWPLAVMMVVMLTAAVVDAGKDYYDVLGVNRAALKV